jgi:hypothetical protein
MKDFSRGRGASNLLSPKSLNNLSLPFESNSTKAYGYYLKTHFI